MESTLHFTHHIAQFWLFNTLSKAFSFLFSFAYSLSPFLKGAPIRIRRELWTHLWSHVPPTSNISSNLIYQLQSGVWNRERKKEGIECIDASSQICKCVRWYTNILCSSSLTFEAFGSITIPLSSEATKHYPPLCYYINHINTNIQHQLFFFKKETYIQEHIRK